MKLELNVVRFENEDVIATSCVGLDDSHLYLAATTCERGHQFQGSYDEEDNQTFFWCYDEQHDGPMPPEFVGYVGWVHFDEENHTIVKCNHPAPENVPANGSECDWQ